LNIQPKIQSDKILNSNFCIYNL